MSDQQTPPLQQMLSGAHPPSSVLQRNAPIQQNEATSQTNISEESPLRSAESFEAYCNRVQHRLAEHASRRASFLQTAFEKLTRLWHTARAVEDNALCQELQAHRVAVRELVDALSRVNIDAQSRASIETQAPRGHAVAKPVLQSTIAPIPTTAPPPKLVPPSVIFPGRVSEEQSQAYPPMSHHQAPDPMDYERSEAPSNYGQFETDHTSNHPIYSPDPVTRSRRPLRPISDIEADAANLRDELQELIETRPLQSKKGDLNAANCLLVRALGCRLRRLAEEGGETEVEAVSNLRQEILSVMDEAGDTEYSVALDEELDPRPTAYQWGELAERYEEMARAQEAFDWWQRNRAALNPLDIQPLAESIAAVQQRFNRLLFRIGARDPFQQKLFDELRVWAREAQCFLQSLRPKVPTIELIERGGTLEIAWDKARGAVEEDTRRTQALKNLEEFVYGESFGHDPANDEVKLRNLVADCRNYRVPANDRRLRDMLMPWTLYLEGDERLRDVVRELFLEWERRAEMGRPEDAAESANLSLDDVHKELDLLRQYTHNKRCLVLGGTWREENHRELEAALEFAELTWPVAKPFDPLVKFDPEIRRTDIVAVMSRFCRREWKAAKILCERDGKKFIDLNVGYNLADIVKAFLEQFHQSESQKAAETESQETPAS